MKKTFVYIKHEWISNGNISSWKFFFRDDGNDYLEIRVSYTISDLIALRAELRSLDLLEGKQPTVNDQKDKRYDVQRSHPFHRNRREISTGLRTPLETNYD